MDLKFFHAIWGKPHRRCCVNLRLCSLIAANSHLLALRRGTQKCSQYTKLHTYYNKKNQIFPPYIKEIKRKHTSNFITWIVFLFPCWGSEAPLFAACSHKAQEFCNMKIPVTSPAKRTGLAAKRDALDIIYCSQHGFFHILISTSRDWHVTKSASLLLKNPHITLQSLQN